MNIDDLIKSLEKIKEEMTPEEREMPVGILSPYGCVSSPNHIEKTYSSRFNLLILEIMPKKP